MKLFPALMCVGLLVTVMGCACGPYGCGGPSPFAAPPGNCPNCAPGGAYPYGGGMMMPGNAPVFGTPGAVGPTTTYGVPGSTSGYAPTTAVPNDGTKTAAEPTIKETIVPEYQDPVGPTAPPPRRPVNTDVGDPADFKGSLNAPKNSAEKLIGTEVESGALGVPGLTNAAEPVDEFAPPKSYVPAGYEEVAQSRTSNKIQTASAKDPVTRPNPYARDPQGESWFRGLVDYDEIDRAWYLIYDPQAPESDPHGGTITLADDPLLSKLKGDDVVLVEGSFDASTLDRYDQPRFKATKIERLIPE